MSSVVPVCAAAALLALLISSVRRTEPGVGGAMSAAVTVWLSFLIAAGAVYMYGEFSGLSDSGFSEYAPYVLKCAGIGFFCQTAAEICVDSGERAVGSKIMTAGKLGMLAVCLPLVKELLQTALGYINGRV